MFNNRKLTSTHSLWILSFFFGGGGGGGLPFLDKSVHGSHLQMSGIPNRELLGAKFKDLRR